MTDIKTEIASVCACSIKTPLKYAGQDKTASIRYRKDSDRVAVYPCFNTDDPVREEISFERAGPREYLAMNPPDVTAAIMTCGGLCPGLNDVIRGLVMSLHHHYGVRKIFGVRYGYAGLTAEGVPPMDLCPDLVDEIHRDGGSMLGVSRGKQDVPSMVATLSGWGVNQLFIIGGDGTQRGALELSGEFKRQGLPVAVVGIPKTIDNDILWADQTFGFDTAVDVAAQVIRDAHVEARSAQRCVGLVKVMGRDSGFIAAQAALASQEANAVLVPEVPFDMTGDCGLLTFLSRRMAEKDHAVIVVAEGAGQELIDTGGGTVKRDASGNQLHEDIGPFICHAVKTHFDAKNAPVNVKYFDPSYSVRSAPANSTDRVYCTRLAHAAVHAAMAGKTGMMVSRWSGHYVHVPLELVTTGRRKINPSGSLWRTVLEATGQPGFSRLDCDGNTEQDV